MDTVMLNPVNGAIEVSSIIGSSVANNTHSDAYPNIVTSNTFCALLKNENVYEIEEHGLKVSNDEYHSALKCIDEFNQKCATDQKLSYPPIGSITLKKDIDQGELETNHVSTFKTDDESMAVEALRQLGGMYPGVVSAEHPLPMLLCNTCDSKFHTTADLHAHSIACKAQMYQNYKCSLCKENYNSEQDFNNHSCGHDQVPCKFCHKSFPSQTDLKEHVDSDHQGNRPYRCQFCNQTFPRTSSLTNHLKIHNYQPGRAILHNDKMLKISNIISKNPVLNVHNWAVDKMYGPESATSHSVPHQLHSWHYAYEPASCSTHPETTHDGIVIGNHETVVSRNYADSSSNHVDQVSIHKDYNYPIKVEMIPYGSEIDKTMDESFPISSIPQMEITVEDSSQKPHICTHCGMTFSREKALISHLRLHVIGWPATHECENCGETFPDENIKSQHKKSCPNDTTVVTQSYEETIALPKKVEPKLANATKPQVKVGKHPCPDCDKRFATKQKMFRHMWIHRKKTFTCELCAMTFEVQTELDKHRLSKHPADSPYVCNECGKSFASRQGLWEHGRIHGNGAANVLTCTKCNKTFASRQGYLIHNRSHTGERPYGCRFCLKAFRDGGTLRKHERIHTGQRPHVCPICMHDFNQKVVLREHVRWVHAAKKVENENGQFTCSVCNMNISDREELCAHIVKHSDQMAAEAKDNAANKPTNNVVTETDPKLAKVIKKVGQKKGNNLKKSESAAAVRPAKTKQKLVEYFGSEVVLAARNFNLDEFEFPPDHNSVECDMCGHKFSSEKDLMTHIQIHI